MSTDGSEEPWDDEIHAEGGDEIHAEGDDEIHAEGDDEVHAEGDGHPGGLGVDRGYGNDGGHSEGGCDRIVPAWLTRLHPMLPETLFVPYHPGRARFCFRKLGKSENCGLVCFSAPDVGEPYRAAFLDRHGFAELRRLSLDEACDLARESSSKVNCVMLIDDPFHPLLQMVG